MVNLSIALVIRSDPVMRTNRGEQMTGANGLHQGGLARSRDVAECTTIRLCWCRAAISQVTAVVVQHVSQQTIVAPCEAALSEPPSPFPAGPGANLGAPV